ncbi:MAG TPA: c-type cytochrome [Thiobacillaceae bacterium]|nr:c-type cytochrome [Thiobacillaceae bacterium]
MKIQQALIVVTGMVSTLAVANPATAPSIGDAKKAENIVTSVCSGCHGQDGNSAAPANPNLAGLGYEYLDKQLTNFKSGERKSPVMGGMVASLSPDDMKDLALYFSTKERKSGVAKDKDLALRGQKIYRGGVQGSGVPACASCHGPQGRGIPVQFPALYGQHADYVYDQLNKFRLGERANDAAKMMRSIAAKMTDAEMKAVAQYIQGLR